MNKKILKYYYQCDRDYFVKLYMLHGQNPLPKNCLSLLDSRILSGGILKTNNDKTVSFTDKFVKIFIDEWDDDTQTE